MASFEITGTLKQKGNTQQVSDKFSKREFVLTIDATTSYPQYVSLQLTQDKCSQLDNFNVGDEMKVSFNLRGREWNSPDGVLKYFNSLEAWRIEKFTSSAQPQPTTNYTATPAMQEQVIAPQNSADDDLPF